MCTVQLSYLLSNYFAYGLYTSNTHKLKKYKFYIPEISADASFKNGVAKIIHNQQQLLMEMTCWLNNLSLSKIAG